MKRKLAVFGLAFAVLSASYIWFSAPANSVQGEPKSIPLPIVDIVNVMTSPESEQMVFYSEIKPKWQTDIIAQVEGKVGFIDRELEQGNVVSANKLLASFDRSTYLLAVEEAKARLQQAKAELAIAESEMKAAKKGWSLSGNKNKPVAPIVLKEPQVAQAKAQVAAAKANLENARLRLSFTEIRAPYDAIIAERMIDPGEAIQEGQKLMTLFNVGAREVAIALTDKQWRSLPEDLSLLEVKVVTATSDESYKKTFKVTGVRKAGFIDQRSRQRFLYLELEGGLPGTFVEVAVKGKEWKNALIIPQTAMSPSGQVWYLNTPDTLAYWRPNLLGSSKYSLYVSAPESGEFRIVQYAHDGLKLGASVKPIHGVKL